MNVTLNRDGSLTVNGITYARNTNEAIDFRSAGTQRKENKIIAAIIASQK